MASIDVPVPNWSNIEVNIDISDYLSEIEVNLDASEVVNAFDADELLTEMSERDICSFLDDNEDSFDFDWLSDETVVTIVNSRTGLARAALLAKILIDGETEEPTAWELARAFLDASPSFDLVKAVVRHFLVKHGGTQERWAVAVGAAIGERLAEEPMPSLYPPVTAPVPAPAVEETENAASAAK